MYSLEELAKLINPYVRGWINYYGKFYPSELKKVLNYVEATLVRWAMGKYKKLRGRKWRGFPLFGESGQKGSVVNGTLVDLAVCQRLGKKSRMS